MMYIMCGKCSHEVRVTYLGNGLYGCRIFTNGKISQEQTVKGKKAIGPACRKMLRWEDKMGNHSKLASSSRKRASLDRE